MIFINVCINKIVVPLWDNKVPTKLAYEAKGQNCKDLQLTLNLVCRYFVIKYMVT